MIPLALLLLSVVLYAGGLGWLHHLGAVPAPGRFLAPDTPGQVTNPVATQPVGGRFSLARGRPR